MVARNFSSGSSTYYDSQSGMEVPINNEDEISVFFENSRNELGGISSSDDMTLEQIQEAGFQGVLVPPSHTEDALAMAPTNMAGVGVGVGVGFTLFVSIDSRRLEETNRYPDHVNPVFEYIEDSTSSLQKRLAAHVENGTKTSIGLFDPCLYHQDPILVASGVATLIDKTGGCDFIWVQPKPNNEDLGGEGDDSIIDLCQQLSYLDVAGPTIKSRLIVTANSEYQVEECLDIGVNKFAVHHPASVKWLGDMIDEQGKQIKLAVSIP
jgi:hypothetical protein